MGCWDSGSGTTLYPDALEREFVIDNLLVRIHSIIVMIRWTGLAPWEFDFPFPGCLTSTFRQTLYTQALHPKEHTRIYAVSLKSGFL